MCVMVGDMATADAPWVLHLLLVCFLQPCLSQHGTAVRECHCTSGCDDNFRCSSGCLQGWSGPSCQILNIALNKPTKQSSTFNDCPFATTYAERDVCGDKTSSLAVDGVVSSRYWSGSCTHTKHGQRSSAPTWWTVDLGETHIITSLTIFFSHPRRMRGFLVWVDNRRFCYRQTLSDLPSSPVNISCATPTRGQHVAVQLPTLAGSEYILNLCEVEIYECADGGFGPGCSSWCYCRNSSEVCDKTTGRCESGCPDGYTGVGCQENCPRGRYGSGCMETCGHCAGGDRNCHSVDGTCIHGCQGNWGGTMCKACPLGRYGSGCMETCGHCAGGDRNCHSVDGTCIHGCQGNWSGALCKECQDYWFGVQCDGECRCQDRYEVCDKRTGQCDSGCEDGWTGLDCNTPCPNGTYGFNCTGRCGRCQEEQPCDRIGGECQTCAPGFKPQLCQECEDYFYGEQCSSTCGQCRGNVSCNTTSGECPDGCEPGRQGMTCHQECDEGRYGDGCSEACGQCSAKCSPVDGSCDQDGCRDGWTGQRCDEACPNGTFGSACSRECGQCLAGHVCDKVTGQCQGCERGWQGLQCLTECQDDRFGADCGHICACQNASEVCDKTSGTCTSGCLSGRTGDGCLTHPVYISLVFPAEL